MPLGTGVPLNAFSEWVALTGPAYLRGVRDIVNDAQKTNYKTLGYILRGQRMSEILQGGQNINDRIFLEAVRVAHSYQSLEEHTYQIIPTGRTWTVPWRFFMTYVAWTDEEIELQGGGDLSRNARMQIYKNLWFSKLQNMYSDNADYWEEILWAVPDRTKMESASGKELYSFPAFINEYPNGLPAAADQPGGTWTTKAQIDPVVSPRWDNQRFAYGAGGAGFTPADPDNILTSLDLAFMFLDFQPPPVNREYFEAAYTRPVGFIGASFTGRQRLMALYRNDQDRWVDMKDPYNNPTYLNAPIVPIAQLNDAAIYPTGAADTLGVETSRANDTNTNDIGFAGPRYYLIQPEYLRTVFHSRRYFKNLGVMTDVSQPTTHVMNINTYGNLVPRSLRRQGLLYPAADNV